MRSNDIFRGLPYNFVQFASMQEILAGWLNINVGSYNHVSDSLHVYERDLSRMESEPQLNLTENLDSLALPKQDFDLVLSELEKDGNCIIDDNIAAESLLGTVRSCKLPTAYRNILCVLSAEGARKRKRPDLVGEIMGLCTNPAYNQLWGRWTSRFTGGKQDNTDQV
jgi:thymidylate synthase